MSFVQYNPWVDAAAYGGALGDKLAEALVRLPMQKKQLAMEQQGMAMRGQQMAFEQDMAQKNYALQQQHYGNEEKRVQGEIDYQRERNRLTDQWHDEKNALLSQKNEQAAQYNHDRLMLGTQIQQLNAQLERQKSAAAQKQAAFERQKLRMQQQQTGSGDKVVTDPVTGRSFPLSGVMTTMANPSAEISMEPGMYSAMKRASAAAYSTNKPVAVPAPVAAPAPAAQPQTVRVKHPNGQTGQIPAEQLQQALKEGYQLIQ